MNQLTAKLHHDLSLFDPKTGLQPQNLKHVLNLLDAVLEKNDESTTNRAPPLDVIIYALNAILYPTFLPEFMSEFLHLFTMVEFYRIRIVEKAVLAIEMNTYYHASSPSDPNVSFLTDKAVKYLTRLIHKQADMRKIYMVVITQSCLLDLRRHWLAGSNTDFWSRWHDYLSILDGTTSHSIHHNLSAGEIKELRDVAHAVLKFMKTTVQDGQQLDAPSVHQAIKTGEFQDAYLPKELSSTLLEAIGYHLDVVRDAVQKFTMEMTEH